MTFNELYDDYEAMLRRYAMSLSRDSHRADDIVQETFIRAMTNMFLLENLASYQRRSWLRSTLKNIFIDEQRTLKRRYALLEQLGKDTEMTTSMPSELLTSGILEQVPERDRELLHQRYVLGMNSSEIASELGIPAATVRSRLHLAIKRLRARKSQFI